MGCRRAGVGGRGVEVRGRVGCRRAGVRVSMALDLIEFL